MRLRTISVTCMLLSVAACAMPPAGSSGTSQSAEAAVYPPDDGVAPDFKDRMRDVGYQYYGMATQGAAFTNNQLQQCYAGQTDKVDNFAREGLLNLYRNSLRRCLVLDYLAFKDNQNATHKYAVAGNPYLSMEATEGRWGHWFPLAGFSGPEAGFRYMRLGYGYSKPYEIQLLQQNRPLTLGPPRGAIFGGT